MFKIGDVCIVIAGRDAHIGQECTITGVQPDESIMEGRECCVEINGFPSDHPTGEWSKMFASLRLKRPPSWNEWIYQTDDILQEEHA